VLNIWLLHFAEMIGATWFSVALHESYYAYAWIESLHVITLTITHADQTSADVAVTLGTAPNM